ncbi:hypothetical protein BYT27DRAFT_7265928 [Phlegmacium glaucopus]|nr:hypothetical protein BYT27DRAFT_7265928 [Phlegmacium glaucopus]
MPKELKQAVAITDSAGDGLDYGVIFGNKNKVNPMTCGLFTIKSSKPTTFDYTCSEFILVLEGELCFEDKVTLQKTIVKAGDVVRIDEGTTVKCSSPSSGKGTFSSHESSYLLSNLFK